MTIILNFGHISTFKRGVTPRKIINQKFRQISTSTHYIRFNEILLSGFREAAMTNCFNYCSKGSVPLTLSYALFNELHRLNKTPENTFASTSTEHNFRKCHCIVFILLYFTHTHKHTMITFLSLSTCRN